MAGKYIIQYVFGAASSAAVQPLLDSIGVGWTFMICTFFQALREPILTTAGVFFSLIGGGLVWVITKWGLDMQQWAEQAFGLAKKPDF